MGRNATIVHDGNEVSQQQHNKVRRNAILQDFQETTCFQVGKININAHKSVLCTDIFTQL